MPCLCRIPVVLVFSEPGSFRDYCVTALLLQTGRTCSFLPVNHSQKQLLFSPTGLGNVCGLSCFRDLSSAKSPFPSPASSPTRQRQLSQHGEAQQAALCDWQAKGEEIKIHELS